MLVTLKEVLRDALKNKYAVGAYNIHNLEYAQVVIEASEGLKAPVILQISQGSSDFAGLHELSKIAIMLAKKAKIPAVVHLDHGKSFLRIIEGIRYGFSSVMFDGSTLSYDDNVRITKQVVEAAHHVGIAVEAEIGKVGKSEDGHKGEDESLKLTSLEEAISFYNDTQVDALAISIGTVHAMEVQEARLNIELLKKIHSSLENVPLVMHGASGVVDEDIFLAIENGITKINIATYLQKKAHGALKDVIINDPKAINFRSIMGPMKKAIKDAVIEKIMLFKTNNKA